MMRLPICAALALCALARAQDPRPLPEPATGPDQRLQKAVDEMIAMVERHAELKFQKRPKVRATTAKEWREIIKRQFEPENGRELFEASFSTFGLYLPDTAEIVLSPLVVGPLIKEHTGEVKRHIAERIAHQKATIAHEIVHALQEQHFQLPSKLAAAESDEDIRRYKLLLEGHAVFVEELIAEKELGLEDFLIKGPYGGIIVDPTYVMGRHYCRHVLREEGMKGVHARLADPPTLDAIVELAQKRHPPAPDAEATGGKSGQGKSIR